MGQGTEEYEGHFSNYAEYSKTYRSWMVGYGIGGPVLLLTGKDAPQALAQSPWLGTIVTLFVFGVAIQIVLALVNKWAAWHMYRGAWSAWLLKNGDPDYDAYEKSRMFHVWDWINRQSWIDLCCDIGALASFSIATWIALSVLLSPR